jgi:hypothetical protein
MVDMKLKKTCSKVDDVRTDTCEKTEYGLL